MTTTDAIDEILGSRVFAVVGASRDGRKYGSIVFADLLDKGYRAYPVNPHASEILGRRAYPTIASLPADVEALVLVMPPVRSEQAVQEALAAGIRRVWMQPGAESAAAVAFCAGNGITVVSGVCLMMQALKADCGQG
ncbi:MAG: CoA-binding protein [Candidatus Aminicenantes bacterium]|nr:CoA-binding protein [Candidatus Aminicenantes bacterium]